MNIFDTPNKSATPENPFDATNLGIAVNTITGLPAAAVKTGVDIFHAFTSSVGSVGVSVGKLFGGPSEVSSQDLKTPFAQALFENTFGKNPVKSLEDRVAANEIALKENPFAKKLGLDKAALPIAFAGVIADAALNLTPFGGEESIAKQLLKETTEEGALKLLTKIGVPEESAKLFSTQFAKAGTKEEVAQLFDLLKSDVGVRALAEKEALQSASEIVPQSIEKSAIPKSTAEIQPLDQSLLSKSSPQVNEAFTGTLAQNLEKVKLSAQPFIDGSVRTPEVEQSIQNIRKALEEAQPLRNQQETIYSKERKARLAESQSVAKTTSGEKGFYQELAPLKGEIPKVQFQSIRPKVSQSDIDIVFDEIKNSSALSGFDKITARKGLAKLFGEMGGTVPTQGEINLLQKVLGKEFIETAVTKQGLWTRAKNVALEIANIPRSVMASFDLSAPFRQGIFTIGRKEFWTSWDDMFKSFGSEAGYKAVQDAIAAMPTHELALESKLALTDVSKGLTNREEQFMSSWAERIPVAGKLIRASGRAYVGFLNKVRADVFADILGKAEVLGLNPKNNLDLTTEIANFINIATGRGSLGKLEPAANALNGFFFSPRLAASRLTLLNPLYYVKANPLVRKEALKSLLSFAGITTTILSLAKAAGAEVGIDPRSADFGKIKIGSTRIDIAGGFQQYIRMAAQLISGQYVSTTSGKAFNLGEGYKPITRLDILQRQVESKEAPIFSFITDLLRGQDYAGNPIKPGSAVVSRLVPMIMQDMLEIAKTNPNLLPLGIPAIFGASLQTYTPNTSKSGGNVFNK